MSNQEPYKFVEWEEKFSVGIDAIDEQHKHLVDITNELYEGCRLGTEEAAKHFQQTIKKAVDYVKTHFKSEEALMEKYDYPDLGNHKKQHEAFVRNILGEVQKFQKGEKFVPNHFVRFLRDWLLEHIAVSDRQYSNFFKSKGTGG